MCKTVIRANSTNMQRSKSVSKIQIDSIVIIYSVLCVIIIGVFVVGVVGLMSVYYCHQKIPLHYQMRGLLERCDFTTPQKQLNCKINNRWHCGNWHTHCVFGQKLLSTMRFNMPVIMLGMYLVCLFVFFSMDFKSSFEFFGSHQSNDNMYAK